MKHHPVASLARVWILLASLIALGASEPEVVKVRVPASKVSAWFPAGTALEVLAPEQFEELLQGARFRPEVFQDPRLLRVKHSARLESDRLIGRSEVTIEPWKGPGARLIVLDPWLPSLDTSVSGSKIFRATSDGKLAVKVDASTPRSVEANWQLQSRAGSSGQAFHLDLPEVEVASLVLDLPAGVVPETKTGHPVGPEPGPAAGRATWRFEAVRGSIDLRLRTSTGDPSEPRSSGHWLEGTTKIDLGLRPTNWRADWILDESPGAPRTLTVELDPGLELVDVVGPRVGSFREESAGQSTRVTIQLEDNGAGPSPLTIRAICHAPTEGLWAIPSARPIDATWTGGRTLVTLDGSRILQACVERAGRRVPPRLAEAGDFASLIFEGTGAFGSVADLMFRKPTADVTVDVRGHLLLGAEVPRFEVALTWTVERGQLLSHAVDLSPGWTPDRVLSNVRQPVPWHVEHLGNGATRVHFGPSLLDENALMLTLTLGATSRKGGVTGPLDLPRVRPAPGVRVIDEVWAATPVTYLSLLPVLGRGLTWIDPLDPPLDDVPAPWVADDLKNALAWRWLADDAEGRIDRILPIDRPRGEVKLDASIESGRLGLHWSLAIDSDRDDLRSIAVHLDEPIEGPIRWRSRVQGGPIIEARPIDSPARAKHGFPATGSAWELEFFGSVQGKVQLEATIDRPWSGQGRIPILTLPDRFRSRGLITVRVDNTAQLEVKSSGLTRIDPVPPLPESIPPKEKTARADDSRTRLAAMFAYRSTGGKLEVKTIGGGEQPTEGLVREAFLVTQAFPGEGMRHRLSLKIAGDSRRTITLKMPVGAAIDRIRRDGQPVIPAQAGSSFQVSLTDSNPSRIDSTLTIDYRTGKDLQVGPIEPATLLPGCSMPCLSFVWELVAPDRWSVATNIKGLVLTDPLPGRSSTARILGSSGDSWSPWGGNRSDLASSGEAMLDDLDKIATESAVGETNLGDWFVKLDAGRRPLVIDRLALRSIGWGPSAKLSPVGPDRKSSGQVKAILQQMGLSATSLGGIILISSRIEAPSGAAELSAWISALQTVPSQGSDPTDRFQSPARWRGEATPRALSASDSPDRSPGLGGWQTRRIVSSGWPAPGASIRLQDTRTEAVWGWFVAAIVVAGGIVTRNRSPLLRALGLVGLGILATVTLAWNWPEPPTWSSGLVRGVLAVMAFWIGCSFRSISRFVPVNSPANLSTNSRRSGLLPYLGVIFWLIVALIGSFRVALSAGLELDLPILALLVSDGPPDASSKPDRVILSLKDAGRLREQAKPVIPLRPPILSLSGASHRVTRERTESGHGREHLSG